MKGEALRTRSASHWVLLLWIAAAGGVTFGALVVGIGPVWAVLSGFTVAMVAWRFGGRPAFGGSLLAAAAVAAPFYFSAFNLSQILVLAIGALGLVLFSGQTGQISVAQGSLVGVGAYTTAVLSVNYSVPALLTIPCGVFAASLVGLVVAIPTSRLRGIYQVITTLAVGVAFPQILIVIGNSIGGSTGIPVSNPLDFTIRFGDTVALDPERLMYVVALAALMVSWLVLSRIIESRHGTAMRALRQNEVVAAVNGIKVSRYRIIAFVYCAAVAGLAGSLYALTVGAVSPDSFGLLYSIQFLVAIALGGSERLAGALVGSMATFLLITQLNGIPIPGTTLTINSEVLYGVAVVLVLLLLRGGIWGGLIDGANLLTKKFGREHDPSSDPATHIHDPDGAAAQDVLPIAAPSRPNQEVEKP